MMEDSFELSAKEQVASFGILSYNVYTCILYMYIYIYMYMNSARLNTNILYMYNYAQCMRHLQCAYIHTYV